MDLVLSQILQCPNPFPLALANGKRKKGQKNLIQTTLILLVQASHHSIT
jgi:hypothetical protein